MYFDSLQVVGLSHRVVDIDRLGRATLGEAQCDQFLHEVRALGIRDALAISTCNRTEFYVAPGAPSSSTSSHLDRESWGDLVERTTGISLRDGYHYFGRSAVDHLLRVACGIDSLVVGEVQIAGQVREAFERSNRLLQPTASFHRLAQSVARSVARARNESEIGRGAVSVASAAIQLVTKVKTDLRQLQVAILGAGETSRLLAEHIASHRPRELLIVNRTLDRAEELARGVGGRSIPLEQLDSVLGSIDLLACAISNPEAIIDADRLRRVRDRSKPLVIVDIGMPRNVDSNVRSIANIFAYDMEDLEQVMEANLATRRREIPKVMEIVAEETEKLFQWERTLDVGPMIAAMRELVELTRQAEVERATRGLDSASRAAVDRATLAVVNKLLHGPTQTLKEVARAQDTAQLTVLSGLMQQ